MHDLTFFLGHAGKNALAQGAECVVVRPQAGEQARPIHHALTERAVFPLALAAKHAVLDMQSADAIAKAEKRAFQNLHLRLRRGGFGRDEVRRIEDDAQIGTADIRNQAAGEFRRVERMQRDGFNAHERMHLFGVCADLAGEIQQAGVSRLTFGFREGEMGRFRADAARAERDARGQGALETRLRFGQRVGVAVARADVSAHDGQGNT